MKEKSFRFVCIIVATIIMAVVVFNSCTSELQEPEVHVGDVKIFMSHASNNTGGPQKISGVGENKTSQNAIQAGDTVNVYNLRDINIVFSAEDQAGFPVYGNWTIHLNDSEKGVTNNNPSIYLLGYPGTGETKKDMVSFKPTMLGVYLVSFQLENYNLTFYVRHLGLPGKIGDDQSGKFAFRMEKNNLQIENEVKKAWTFYIKSDEYLFGKKVKALVYGNAPQYSLTTENGSVIKGARIFEVHNCEYSPGYLTFSIIEEEFPPILGRYTMDFFAGSYWYDWYKPESTNESNWTKNGQFVFQTF